MALTDPNFQSIIDPTLQRGMFKRPGQDIGDITRGIMSGAAGQQSTEVAARPLQVASAGQSVRSQLAGGFVNWIDTIVREDFSNVPLNEAIDQYNSSVRFRAEHTPPPEVIPEGYEFTEEGLIVPIEPEVAAQPLEKAAAEEPAEVSGATVQPVVAAANEAAGRAVAANEVNAEDANAAVVSAQGQVNAMLSDEEPETEDDFLLLYAKALDIDGLKDKNYNAKAKAILGIDPDETDVPTWAAPMFMFGLKLMQGPVTGKTEGRSFLGGFLGDIGAAGAEAFPLMAAGRARKRKEKAAVGNLAYQLEQSDRSAWANLLKAQRDDERWHLKFGQTEAIRIDGLLDSTIKLYTQGENAETVAKFSTAFNTAIEGLVPGTNADGTEISAADQNSFRKRIISNATVRNLIGAKASEDAGITTGMDLETIPMGMGEITIDKTRLAKVAAEKGKPEGEILQEALNAYYNSTMKHPGVIIAEGIDPSSVEMKTMDIGDGLQQNVIIDKTQFGTAGYKPTNLGPAFDPKRPESKEVKYKDLSGVERIILYDPAKLRASGKTLNEAIESKDTDIISGNMVNYTGNVSDIPIYINNRKGRAIFDENAFQAWKAENPDRTNISYTDKDYFEEFQRLGIIKVFGDTIASGETTKISQIMPDGSVQMIEAQPGDLNGVLGALDDKTTRRNMDLKRVAILNLNRVSWELENEIATSDIDPAILVGAGTDAWAGFASLVRQAKVVITGKANRSLNNLTNNEHLRSLGNKAGRSEEMRNMITSAFDIRSGFFKGIEAGEDRQALRSYLIETAFALASAREGGKLTDNDVKYAFETLGWQDGKWSQTPEQLMSGLRAATGNQTESFLSQYGSTMSPELLARAEDRGIFEHLIAEDMRLRGPAGWKKTALGRYYEQQLLLDENNKIVTDETGFPKFKPDTNFRFDRRELSRAEKAGEVPSSTTIMMNIVPGTEGMYRSGLIVENKLEIPARFKPIIDKIGPAGLPAGTEDVSNIFYGNPRAKGLKRGTPEFKKHIAGSPWYSTNWIGLSDATPDEFRNAQTKLMNSFITWLNQNVYGK